MGPTVLSFPRIDDGEPKFVLLHVSSSGARPLDLKLIGSEQSNVFSVSIKESKTSKLKDKKFPYNQDQWDSILSVVLLGEARDKEDSSVTEGLEAVAEVDGETAITIRIRKRVERIIQPLGSITLSANEEEEADFFAWCGLAIQEKDTSKQELEALRAALNTKDAELKKLKDSEAELVRSKTENETQLLEKFSLLLNEKKLKIRDQQRLLACANVDPAKLAEVEAGRSTAKSHSPGPSRKGKRKAAQGSNSDDGSDAGDFEAMEVDVPPAADDSEQEQEETASEAESDDEPLPPPTRKAGNDTKGKEVAKNTPPVNIPGPVVLPPKRELPFSRKPPAPPPATSAAPVEGSETESDDEL
ncbi:related to mitotic apparatus protein p62 [Phialocephala subalpina]|uniref:Related to mitotic apparatus protein p62 n=1 Tax=Phialocephala subalpina TaxID=576137 RepID=A0A1L7WLU3_9HELO|nr:related to mitotic apparatus protein p62 [Phialocephala subalpina]